MPPRFPSSIISIMQSGHGSHTNGQLEKGRICCTAGYCDHLGPRAPSCSFVGLPSANYKNVSAETSTQQLLPRSGLRTSTIFTALAPGRKPEGWKSAVHSLQLLQ